jgi:hypothetical protein
MLRETMQGFIVATQRCRRAAPKTFVARCMPLALVMGCACACGNLSGLDGGGDAATRPATDGGGDAAVPSLPDSGDAVTRAMLDAGDATTELESGPVPATVDCVTTTCKVGLVCCWGNIGQPATASCEQLADCSGEHPFACDDSDDCVSNQATAVCCATLEMLTPDAGDLFSSQCRVGACMTGESIMCQPGEAGPSPCGPAGHCQRAAQPNLYSFCQPNDGGEPG